MKMNDAELRELDLWIAVNIFGWQTFNEEEYPHRMLWREGDIGSPVWDEPDFYTTDPAAAMEVLKRCSDEWDIQIGRRMITKEWFCSSGYAYTQAETIELAICQFAKKLFIK